MQKLLSLLLGALLLGNYTQTYASPIPFASDMELTDAEKLNGKTQMSNDPAPAILSKLFMETAWAPNMVNGCAASIPNSFKPKPSYNELLKIEALGISKIEVKIYNNWGVQVAESSLVNRNIHNVFSKKSSLSQNDIKFYQDMKEGIYYYELNISCFNGEKTVKEGEIRLMKSQKK